LDVPVKSEGGLIEFLASLHAEAGSDSDYVTTKQIRDTLGISERKTLALLRNLIDTGVVEHGYVSTVSIDKRIVRSNGYRLVTK